MKRITLWAGAIALGIIAASLIAAAPQGPRKITMTVCHYSDLHHQWNTLELGESAYQQHLTEHHMDYAGACSQ